ncbi:family with sequence similarity 206, member A [Nesidiocoris tenuis]|nr:family with sequence similarity 206, member A [Nesidiocoris tenuis]
MDVDKSADFQIEDIASEYGNSQEPYSNFIDRYFTARYAVDVRHPTDDYRILVHSNRVCIVTLAPSHELLANETAVDSVSFQVSENRNTLNTKISGKRKHNAQRVQPNTAIAIVSCSGEQSKSYKLVPGVHGKLLEMNKELLERPNLILEDPSEKGYLAIILPDPSQVEALKKNLLTPQDYEEFVKNRSNSVG